MRTIPRWSGYAFLLALPFLCHCQVTQQLFRASLTSGSGAADTQIVVSGAVPFIPDSRNPGEAYVDSELMKILSVQTTGTFGNVQANTVLTVQRGQGGTAAAQHNAGALIYVGYLYQFITTTPSGACSPGSANLLNYNTGNWFSCEASVWVSRPTATSSGSGGLTAPGTNNVILKYTNGLATAPALFADFAALLSGTPSSSTFARGDGAWATPSGSGDVVGPASSVNGNVALFSGTTGKLLSDSGLLATNLVTLAGTQTLTNKNLNSGTNTFPTLNQSTTGNAATATALAANPADCPGSQFANAIAANGDLTCAVPAGGGNVNNTGTPTSGQLALWAASTVIQGLTALPAANFPAQTGDITNSAGSLATTLAAVGSAGSCGDSTHSCQLTFDTKGRETARANVAIAGGGAASSIVSGPLSGIPGTGAAGNVYFATDQPAGEQLYQWDSTNHFTQTFLHDTTIVNTAGSFGVNLSQFCQFTNSCPVASLWSFAIGQDYVEQASGSTPAGGKLHIYANTDHTFHQVTSGGVDSGLGGGSVTTHWVLATRSVTQSIPTGLSLTNILYDTNDANTTNAALHSTSSNTQNFVADTTGLWHGNCEVSTQDNAVSMAVVVFVNGTPIANGGAPSTVSQNTGWQVNVPWSVHLTSGDIVKCQAESNTGFTSVAGVSTQFWMTLIH